MEGVTVNTQNILDACTIINFLHIDEDEFLIKLLKAKKIYLCRKVFEETNKNVFNKFKGSVYNQSSEAKSKIKEIEVKLNYFRERIYYPEDYYQLKEEVANLTNSSKENGEFISVLLTFYLSKYEELSVTFHTDDIPAKQHFLPFFESENIGNINDSIDLLLLLFQSNSDFTTNDLKKYLSSLYTEYTFAIGGLLKEISEFKIPSNLKRNKKFRITKDAIWLSLRNLDILSLIDQYYLVVEHKAEFRPLYDILSKYEYFFKQKISNEYLFKIKYYYDYV